MQPWPIGCEIAAGSRGLVCLPYFTGERTPINDPMARGVCRAHVIAHTRRICIGRSSKERRSVFATTSKRCGYGRRPKADRRGRRRHAESALAPDRLRRHRKPQSCRPRRLVPRTVMHFWQGWRQASSPIGMLLREQWVSIDRVIQPNPAERRDLRCNHRVYHVLYASMRDQMHALARLGSS